MTFIPVARVINLDRSTERLATCGPRLTAAGIYWQRHAATAPTSLEEALSHPLYRSATMRKLHGRDMSRGEIGCFLSHMAAMKSALAVGTPLALILEDDALPFDGAKIALEALSHWLTNTPEATVDWLHLSRSAESWSRPLATVSGFGIRRTYRPPWCLSASLYTRKGMQDFLRHVDLYGMDRPVDVALRVCFCRSARAAVLDAPIFGENGSESTIDSAGERPVGMTKIRQWRRKAPEYAFAAWNRWRSA
ncbi:glycosyltransferase family 25 protein [Pseudotabrizicola sediminis]|nr:glycosyltransferase family 25 protein [Pseudotabrizicola sediminis]